MKYDDAIENMKMIQESMEVSLAMMGARTKNYSYPKQLEALDLAIEALREKAEREKGCEYCLNQKTIFQDCDNGFSLEIEEEEISVWDEMKCVAIFSISNCPMCGRKLGEK